MTISELIAHLDTIGLRLATLDEPGYYYTFINDDLDGLRDSIWVTEKY